MFYVYFALSLKNEKVYAGRTAKLPEERVSEHNKGGNAWTRNNRPFQLIYYESYSCLEDARAREKFYKTGFGKQLKKVIAELARKSWVGSSIGRASAS